MDTARCARSRTASGWCDMGDMDKLKSRGQILAEVFEYVWDDVPECSRKLWEEHAERYESMARERSSEVMDRLTVVLATPMERN